MVQLKTNKLQYFSYTTLAIILSSNISLAVDIDTNMTRMQGLDKITGRVNEIDIPVGGEAKFGSFSIIIRRCVTRSPEETPENTAFVDIVDTYNQETPQNIFKGWMFSSSPALNAVEHPIYDVWLLKCYNGDSSKFTKLSNEELSQRDSLPMLAKSVDNIQDDIISDTSSADSTDTPQQNTETISVIVDTTISQSAENIKDENILDISIPEIEIEENGFEESEEDEVIENSPTSEE